MQGCSVKVLAEGGVLEGFLEPGQFGFDAVAAHDFGLLRVDYGLAVWAAIVSEEVTVGHINFAVLETLPVTPRDVLGDKSGFFLGEGAHDGDEEFAWSASSVETRA